MYTHIIYSCTYVWTVYANTFTTHLHTHTHTHTHTHIHTNSLLLFSRPVLQRHTLSRIHAHTNTFGSINSTPQKSPIYIYTKEALSNRCSDL